MSSVSAREHAVNGRALRKPRRGKRARPQKQTGGHTAKAISWGCLEFRIALFLLSGPWGEDFASGDALAALDLVGEILLEAQHGEPGEVVGLHQRVELRGEHRGHVVLPVGEHHPVPLRPAVVSQVEIVANFKAVRLRVTYGAVGEPEVALPAKRTA